MPRKASNLKRPGSPEAVRTNEVAQNLAADPGSPVDEAEGADLLGLEVAVCLCKAAGGWVEGCPTHPRPGVVDDAATGDAQLVISCLPGATCACGCGTSVTNKRRFRQGHDQRLIGVLANAAASGWEVTYNQGTHQVTGSAQTYGAQVLTPAGAAKLDAAIKRATNKARRAVKPVVSIDELNEKYARRVREQQLRQAKAVQDIIQATRNAPGPGDEVKVRIGRHEYFARVRGMNQSGKVTAVVYRTKADPNTDKVTEKFTIVND